MTTKRFGPTLVRSHGWHFMYREQSSPKHSDLQFITYGTYHLAPNGASGELFHRTAEALLFCIKGTAEVSLAGQEFSLSHYDTLYVPLATPYEIRNRTLAETCLIVCQSPARAQHPFHYSAWETVRRDEKRIRHLKGKDVYLMFDVSEAADKLIAGYTIFQPYVRAWPAHNHTDQEEVYIFINGRGAMEVYLSEEEKSFVTSVDEMDAVTTPFLWYHPIFSQEQELHFIWCIAGERYWVGDKDKDFMKGDKATLTT